jgi:hypothetical protein
MRRASKSWKPTERAKAAVAETPGSHAIYVSKPKVVVRLIEQAAAEPVAVAH